MADRYDALIDRLRHAPVDRALCYDAANEIAALREQDAWWPIETAPKDGTRFWGLVGDDALAMFWHPQFAQFITGCRRLTLAPGYTYEDGSKSRDYAPEIRSPTHWMPLPPPPLNQEGGDADEPRRIEPHVATPAPGENSERAEVARWMIKNGFATGHGDTITDLLSELSWQVTERVDKARRSMREEAAKVAEDEAKAILGTSGTSIALSSVAHIVAERIRAIPEKQP